MYLLTTNPEIQLDALRQASAERVREAALYRLARSAAADRRGKKAGRWPRLTRRLRGRHQVSLAS
jgi:hypothetical protein